MTVSSETNKYQYTGNGATIDFAYNQPLLDTSHLKVLEETISTGVTQTLVENTDYTIIGVDPNDPPFPSGVTVRISPAPSSDIRLTLKRSIPLTQETDYTESDPFPAQTHENALDKLTMMSQELDEVLSRVPKLAEETTLTSVDLPTPEADQLLGWNSGATNLENKTVAATELVLPSMTSKDDFPVLVDEGGNTFKYGSGALAALAYLATVGTTEIDDSAVTAAKLATDAVTTAKIASTNVTAAKLNSDVFATQANQEAASSNTVAVTPGRQHYHPGSAKAWCHFDGSGTVEIDQSYNVTSLTDNGTGDYSVNLTTAFSDTTYCPVASAERGASVTGFIECDSASASSIGVRSYNSSQVATDHDDLFVVAFGDQ